MQKNQMKTQYNLQNNKINGKYSFFLEYYNKAFDESDDEVIIGEELKTCLKNLVRDLKNENYYYDLSDAELRIEFIETFVVHTKSPFNGKPFLLELWEKAVIEVFYSFKKTTDNYRRFKKLILLVARKNGKSTFCAALAFAEFMIGNAGSDIICSSNDDAQANLIFDEIANMRQAFDPKNKRTHKNLKGIFNLKTKSTIKKLSDKTRNKEGRNIEFAIVDESHEMKDNVIAKSIEQSQSIKPEPVFINITTEGFTDDGYLDKELNHARMVLNGERETPSLLVWLYTMDNEKEIYSDENTWKKANPSLGKIKRWEYLQDQLDLAKVSKADRVFTLAKDFNIKQNNVEAWLMEQDIVNNLKFDIEDFKGCYAIAATDLSETTDLSSARILLMRKEDKRKYFFQHYFIPESKVEEGSKQDKKDYLQWAKEDLLTISIGNEVDYSDIVAWYISLWQKYDIRIFHEGHDKWNAKSYEEEMESYGFDVERIRQDYQSLSTPMKLLEADLKSNLVNYNQNPIDIWCLKNTACIVDKYGRIMPAKTQGAASRRIDGGVTMIIAYAVLDRYKKEYMDLISR